MNTKKIIEAIGLLKSMVDCGEKHSEQSQKVIQEAFDELSAKKPLIINSKNACPECRCDLYRWYSFCPDCGQKLNWD